MFEPISARLASSCSRNGISAAETPTSCFGRDVHVLDRRSASTSRKSPFCAAEDLLADDGSVVVTLGVGRRQDRVELLVGAQLHDLVGDLAVLHHPVGRRQEAVLVDAA